MKIIKKLTHDEVQKDGREKRSYTYPLTIHEFFLN